MCSRKRCRVKKYKRQRAAGHDPGGNWFTGGFAVGMTDFSGGGAGGGGGCGGGGGGGCGGGGGGGC